MERARKMKHVKRELSIPSGLYHFRICVTGLQHPPSVRRVYAHVQHELVVLLTAQTFGEGVSRLVIGGNVIEGDFFVFDLLSQEVMAHLDVFCAIMEFWVLCNGDGGLVVNKKGSGSGKWLKELCEKSPEPDSLLCGMGCSDVLGLGTG